MIQQKLSELLKQEKKRNGSLNKVRLCCNVSVTQLEKYMKGTSYPRLDTAVKLFDFFNLKLEVV